MKNTSTYSYKLAVAATSLVMVYFVSGIASIAQATDLVKAERVQEINLIQQAQDSLAISFSTLSVDSSLTKTNNKMLIAEQNNTDQKNQTLTLTTAILLAE